MFSWYSVGYMRIMLFGGSFDPPHNGHITVVKQVLVASITDEVWFVPCRSHPFNKAMSPAKHRQAMLNTLSMKGTQVADYELHKEGKSYSLDTLNHYSSEFPEHTFSWLIGSDQLPNFHKWHRYLELLQRYRVYVYPRSAYPFTPLYDGMVPMENMPSIPISSTEVRMRVKAGKPIDSLVPPQVLSYISSTALYNA